MTNICMQELGGHEYLSTDNPLMVYKNRNQVLCISEVTTKFTVYRESKKTWRVTYMCNSCAEDFEGLLKNSSTLSPSGKRILYMRESINA